MFTSPILNKSFKKCLSVITHRAFSEPIVLFTKFRSHIFLLDLFVLVELGLSAQATYQKVSTQGFL